MDGHPVAAAWRPGDRSRGPHGLQHDRVFGRCSGAAHSVMESAAQEANPAARQAGAVVLQDVDGQDPGRATLVETFDGLVSIDASVEGLEPGDHGSHVHAVGVCDLAGDTPFASAGGHFNACLPAFGTCSVVAAKQGIGACSCSSGQSSSSPASGCSRTC